MISIVRILYAKEYDIDKEVCFGRWMVQDMTERNVLFSGEGMNLWDNSGYSCYKDFMQAYLLGRWADYAMCN